LSGHPEVSPVVYLGVLEQAHVSYFFTTVKGPWKNSKEREDVIGRREKQGKKACYRGVFHDKPPSKPLPRN
jgi:hypothetical protein